MVEIGVPLKNPNDSALHNILRLKKISGISKVRVAINPPFSNADFLRALENGGIEVVVHEQDLGLYGNFRYLMELATEEFFAWQCLDDLISSDISPELYVAGLNILPWAWQEFDPGHASHYGDKTPGVYPDLSTQSTAFISGVKAEPSWIFGIWKTNYLKSIFPKEDFDWLDLHLLQKALWEGQVSVAHSKSETLIGTWNWSDKIPYSIGKKGPKSWKITFEMLKNWNLAASFGIRATLGFVKQLALLTVLAIRIRAKVRRRIKERRP